ncbi:MAG: tetratricopeptide repeat protein [Phycisphaerales bacterium]|nr:tetratricopeptide repeat protein [Phycisphaerales bacterium]
MSAQEHNPASENRASMHGLTIGDFEILDEIGRGGMGVVYRARQISLDRIVALKILAYGRGLSDQAVTRFRREAQATAKLHHPNIVPVYAQGQQDNTYFYAMELVSGTSLYDEICQLRRGEGPGSGKSRDRSPSSSDPGFAGGSSDILAETEIIERPLGEETIDAPGHIVIDDDRVRSRFGSASGAGADAFASHTPDYFDSIARQTKAVADALGYAHQNGVIHRDIKPHNLLFGSGDRLCLSDFGLARIVEQPGVTQTGDFVGSPLYMSPEQITGKGGEVGVRSDIYSLGATLYEWMTLQPPFPGTTREQVISRVITEDPPSPRSINRRIPLDLETICLKALSRDPSRRYATAWDLRDDLERFLNRGVIKARRTSLLGSIGKTISRNRVASVVAVAAILIAVLTFALLKQKSDNKTAEKAVAEKQQLVESVTEKNKELEQKLREGDTSPPTENSGADASANPISEQMQRGEQLASMLKGPLASLLSSGEEESDTPINDGQRIGALFVDRMRKSESVRLADVSPGTIAPESPEGLYIAALAEDRPKTAVAKLDECLRLDPSHVQAHLLRAWHQCRLGNVDAMRSDANAVLAKDPKSAEALLARSAVRFLRNRHKLAVDDAEQAGLELKGDVRVDLLRGLALAGMGRWPAALDAMNLVLIIEPNNVLARMVRARALFDLGRFNHAIVDLNRVIEQEPKRADALELRGDCYEKLGEYKLAKDDFAAVISANGDVTFSLATKLVLLTQKMESQDEESKQDVANSRKNGTNRDSTTSSPAQDAVKGWLEKLLGNSDGEKNESGGLRMIAPDSY